MAMQQLIDYYMGKFTNLEEQNRANDYNNREAPDENMDVDNEAIEEVEEEVLGLLKEEIRPKRRIPVLLKRLSERHAENIDYIGVSFGLTKQLLKFWKKLSFVPIYLSQKSNDLTGEHTCIAINNIQDHENQLQTTNWLSMYYSDFRRRFLKLLAKTFREFPTAVGLSLLDSRHIYLPNVTVNKTEIDLLFLPHDLQRLEEYMNNQIEFRLMLDLTADLASLYFQGKLKDVPLDVVQKAILLGMGVQGKVVDTMAEELNMPGTQILAKFYDCMKKITKKLISVVENHIADKLTKNRDQKMTKCENQGTKEKNGSAEKDKFEPINISLNDELNEMENQLTLKQKNDLIAMKLESFKEYKIKGSEKEWSEALGGTSVGYIDKKLISIKR